MNHEPVYFEREWNEEAEVNDQICTSTLGIVSKPKRRAKGLTYAPQFLTDYTIGNLIHADAAIRFRISCADQTQLAPSREECLRETLRIVSLRDMQAHLYFGVPACRFTQLFVLGRKLEFHRPRPIQ